MIIFIICIAMLTLAFATASTVFLCGENDKRVDFMLLLDGIISFAVLLTLIFSL